MEIIRSSRRKLKATRSLQVENLETRQTMNADFDDQIGEAIPIQVRSDVPAVVAGNINVGVDVDMFRFQATPGQTIDFDIDTNSNGPGGLGSFIRIFNSAGQQLASNNDAAAPGEANIGFDSYLRYRFQSGGTYYIGVSNWTNTTYNPITGNGDRSGGAHATGAYQLRVQSMPVDTDDSLSEARWIGSISNQPRTVSGEINWDVDVDMYAFQVTAGQTVDFDIDTVRNGPGGLGSFMRLFNSAGQQLAANDNAAAPGESLGFDSFIRHRFTQGGTYYVGVSAWFNNWYNPRSGDFDASGWQHAIGTYQLIVRTSSGAAAQFSPVIDQITTMVGSSTSQDLARLDQDNQPRVSVAAQPANQAAMMLPSFTRSAKPVSSVGSVDDWFASLERKANRTEQDSLFAEWGESVFN